MVAKIPIDFTNAVWENELLSYIEKAPEFNDVVSNEDALALMNSFGVIGELSVVRGYLYHPKRIFTADVMDIQVGWGQGEFEVVSERVYVPVVRAKLASVWINPVSCAVTFSFKFGKNSCVALRYTE